MGSGGAGATAGVAFGLAVALLAQQLGLVDLGSLGAGLLLLLGFSVLFGAAFGVLGWVRGRRRQAPHSAS